MGRSFYIIGRAPYTFHKGLLFFFECNERPLQISNMALQIIIPSAGVTRIRCCPWVALGWVLYSGNTLVHMLYQSLNKFSGAFYISISNE